MATLSTYFGALIGLISDDKFVCTVSPSGVKIFDLNTGVEIGYAGLGSCTAAAINRHGIYLTVSVATGVRFLPASTGYVGDQTANLQILSTPELSAAYNTGISASGGALALVHTNGIDLFPDSSDLATRYDMPKSGVTDVVIRGDRLAFAAGGEVFFSELPKRSWDHEFMIQAGEYLTPADSVAVRMPNQLAHMIDSGETGVGRMVGCDDNLIWYSFGTAWNFYVGKMTTFGPYSRTGKAKGTWTDGSFQGLMAPRNDSDFDGAIVRWAVFYRLNILGDELWQYKYVYSGISAGPYVYTRKTDPNTGFTGNSVFSKLDTGKYIRVVQLSATYAAFDDTYYVRVGTGPVLELYKWNSVSNDRYDLVDSLDLSATYGDTSCTDLIIVYHTTNNAPYLLAKTTGGTRRFYIGGDTFSVLSNTYALPDNPAGALMHIPGTGIHVSRSATNGQPIFLNQLTLFDQTLLGTLDPEVLGDSDWDPATLYLCGDYYIVKYDGGNVGFFKVGPALTATTFSSIVDLKLSKDVCFVAVPGEGVYGFTLDDPTPQLITIQDVANLKSIAPSDFATLTDGLLAFSTTNDSGVIDLANPG
jgi:hypothetical protein